MSNWTDCKVQIKLNKNKAFVRPLPISCKNL